MKKKIQMFLEEQGIVYQLLEHLAVFTFNDLRDVEVPGVTLKNLFVHDKASNQFYLVMLPGEKRLDMKQLQEVVGSKRLSFGHPKALMTKLGVEPGSVSPLCLLNNTERDVNVFIDRKGWEADIVSIHPNDNTESLVLDRENFHRLIEALHVTYKLYDQA